MTYFLKQHLSSLKHKYNLQKLEDAVVEQMPTADIRATNEGITTRTIRAWADKAHSFVCNCTLTKWLSHLK